ncbi:spermidine/putrescine transport system permease protein [Alkalibacterium olivapovliticus]|uniref:Spermidine/putrescine transport system permease protein n=1 Tax=Alkalibacterium olivapovliticus TaxID=99907 RepID=A0A2T0WA01_9LACT|nr:spermidine/putrescine transport system permease protein [Alkalibacterium olivapovliticus]
MIKNNKWASLYLVVVFILLYTPIAYLIFYSFNEAGTMNQFSGFTLEHYAALAEDTRLMIIALDTIRVALLSALLATTIGTLGAIGIYYSRRRETQNLLLGFNNILLVSPDVIIGASFLLLFTVVGFRLGFYSVLLSHIAFSIPIVVLMVLPRLEEMNENMITAAKDLGATNWQVLKEIILPNITPGILAGYFMAFTYSIDDFAVTFFVTGNGFATLSVEIYSRARQGVSLEINALSTVLFLVAFSLVAGYYFIQKQQRTRKLAHMDPTNHEKAVTP